MSPISASRERAVLETAARGLTVEEAAAELFLSPETVRTYRKRVLQRTGARNMTHAVALWMAGEPTAR